MGRGQGQGSRWQTVDEMAGAGSRVPGGARLPAGDQMNVWLSLKGGAGELLAEDGP